MSSQAKAFTQPSIFSRIGQIILDQPLAALAFTLLFIIVFGAAFAPLLSQFEPNQIDLQSVLQSPNAVHWFGTDDLGRDLFSRVLYGARPSLIAAIAIVAIGSVPGTLIGCFSGYTGGLFDLIIMRIVEIMMALPGLVVALALTAALGPSLSNAVIAIGVMSIPAYVRIARGQALSIREKEYVQASVASGGGTAYNLMHHIIPNVFPTILVFLTFHMGGAILASSALSFIGLGAQPPLAEWGAIIGSGRDYLVVQWWYCLFPGLAIGLTAASVNILGDFLRDRLEVT